MVKIAIGIDPGKDGYITVIRDMIPTSYPIPKIVGGKEVDMHGLASTLFSIAEGCDMNTTIVGIEDVHAIPKSSARATFSFGGICWALRMACIMLGFPVVLIAPKKWQKEMYEGVRADPNKKAMSVLAAKRLFPEHNLLPTPRSKVPDHNLTDSLLIAEYVRRNYL